MGGWKASENGEKASGCWSAGMNGVLVPVGLYDGVDVEVSGRLEFC